MKSCCLETWWETNVAIRMITWEITRKEPDGDALKSQDEMFPISYTCYKCKTRWNNRDQPYPEFVRGDRLRQAVVETYERNPEPFIRAWMKYCIRLYKSRGIPIT